MPGVPGWRDYSKRAGEAAAPLHLAWGAPCDGLDHVYVCMCTSRTLAPSAHAQKKKNSVNRQIQRAPIYQRRLERPPFLLRLEREVTLRLASAASTSGERSSLRDAEGGRTFGSRPIPVVF